MALNIGECYIFYLNVENMAQDKVDEYVTKVRPELTKIGATENNTAIIPIRSGLTRLERI